MLSRNSIIVIIRKTYPITERFPTAHELIMLSKVHLLTYFLLMSTMHMDLLSEAPKAVEIGFEITPEQLISRLSEEDKDSLTKFFREMLLQSQGGYVLFGIKPICLESINTIDCHPKSNLGFHAIQSESEMMRKGLEVWNRLPISKEGAPIEIIVYDQPDPPFYDCRHVLFIHRKALLDVVNESLPLFKSILGPETTAKALIAKLCKPNSSFFSTLASNKILMGIVLGFGIENAIYGSRLEIIEDALQQVERPPLARRSLRAGITLATDNYPCLGFLNPLKGNEPQPSLGFENLSEEHNALQAQIALSTELVVRSSPTIPLFGCLKSNSREKTELLSRYAEAQKKIQSLLASNSFLKDVFTLILSEMPRPVMPKALEIHPSPSFEAVASKLKQEYSKKDLPDQVASLLWDNLLESEKDGAYVEKFIAGMRAMENDRQNKKGPTYETVLDIYKPIKNYIAASTIKDGHNNIAEGEKAIQTLANNANIVEVICKKLYYRVVTKGQGSKLTVDHSNATAQYMLYYLGGRNSGKLIASSASDELNLSELIPGLAHGILGMQTGEIREIYIHPDYAYGFRSNFEPGVAISARVELISLPPKREGASIKFPILRPVDKGLTGFPEPLDENQMEELRLNAAHAEGYSAWWFYGLGSDDLYTLSDVLSSFQRKQKEFGKFETTSSDFVPTDFISLLYERMMSE